MALLRGGVFDGAIFSGALFGPEGDRAESGGQPSFGTLIGLVPETYEERERLKKKLEKAEELITQAEVIAESPSVESITDSVVISRALRESEEELSLSVDIDRERLNFLGLLGDYLSMIERINRQIEELDVVFMIFMLEGMTD